jgi:hypothetical protein
MRIFIKHNYSGRQKAEKWQYYGRAFIFRGAIMVLTKNIQGSVYQANRRFLYAIIFGWRLKSKLSQSEKNLRVIEMRIVDHLSEDQLKRLNYNKKSKTEVKKKKTIHEYVDWKDIMGMNRDTYRRKGGAIRRR